MKPINSMEAKKVSDVFHALFNGYCPNDDTLLEKLRTWLETSVNDAGTMGYLLSQNSTLPRSLVLCYASDCFVFEKRIQLGI